MNDRMKAGHQNVSQVQYAVSDAHCSLRYTHKYSNEQLGIAAQPHSAKQANCFLPPTIYHHGRATWLVDAKLTPLLDN